MALRTNFEITWIYAYFFICFVCLITSRVIEWLYFFNISFIWYFIFPFGMSYHISIWDVIYMVLVITTYSYIFCIYKKRMERIKSQASFKSSNRKHFKLFVPTFLIVNFIILVCIPDFVNLFTHLQYLEGKGLIFQILGVFYRIAWLADPLIYIYDSKLFRGEKI